MKGLDNCIPLRRNIKDVELVNRDFVRNRIHDMHCRKSLENSYHVVGDAVRLRRSAKLQKLYNCPYHKLILDKDGSPGVPDTLRKHISKVLENIGGYENGDEIIIDIIVRRKL